MSNNKQVNTSKMEEIYQKIADTVNETILEDWDKVYVYASIREGLNPPRIKMGDGESLRVIKVMF